MGHGLRNEDAARSIYLREAIEVAWQKWKKDSYSSEIFYGFIEDERNTLLKQYRFENERKIYVEDATGGGQQLVLIGGKVVAPAAALRIAWEWWQAEIGRIERHAADIRQEKRTQDAPRESFCAVHSLYSLLQLDGEVVQCRDRRQAPGAVTGKSGA